MVDPTTKFAVANLRAVGTVAIPTSSSAGPGNSVEQHANQVEATDQPGTAEHQTRSHPPPESSASGDCSFFPNRQGGLSLRREEPTHPARGQIDTTSIHPALCRRVRASTRRRAQTDMAETTHVVWGDIVPGRRATAPCQSRFPNAQICTCLHAPALDATAFANLVLPRRQIPCTRVGWYLCPLRRTDSKQRRYSLSIVLICACRHDGGEQHCDKGTGQRRQVSDIVPLIQSYPSRTTLPIKQ